MYELNVAEIEEVAGGRIGFWLIASICDAGIDFCKGFSDGFNGK